MCPPSRPKLLAWKAIKPRNCEPFIAPYGYENLTKDVFFLGLCATMCMCTYVISLPFGEKWKSTPSYKIIYVLFPVEKLYIFTWRLRCI